jgi:hypothetical protein
LHYVRGQIPVANRYYCQACNRSFNSGVDVWIHCSGTNDSTHQTIHALSATRQTELRQCQENYERSLQSLSTNARNEWDARLVIRSNESRFID